MNKLTITLEYENKDDPLVKQLMSNFVGDVNIKGAAIVYAMSREDLFQKLEDIENIIDDWDMTSGDKLDMIREVL